ncbi:hypothetical protein B1B_12757, partial [mine drainage metagenome]
MGYPRDASCATGGGVMEPDLSGVDPLAHNLATRVCVGDALTRSASMFPERPAVVDRGTVVSYRELDGTAEAL